MRYVRADYDRWMASSHPYHTGGEFEYWTDTAGFNEVIRRVAVVDANTVQIDLNFPQGPFLLNMALFAFAIASPTALAADIGNAYQNPVGTGAFRFVEWVPGDRIVLERNPDYWGEQASVERVVIRIIPDNAARFLALRSGAIDIMDGPNPDDVRNARGDRSLSVITRPPLNVGYINMNLKERPFSDNRVRHAIAAAINRPAIVDALYGGSGMVASQLIPPSLLGWN